MIIDLKCQWRYCSWKGDGVDTCKNLSQKKKKILKKAVLHVALEWIARSQGTDTLCRRWSLSKEVKDRYGHLGGSVFNIYMAGNQSGTWILTLLCLYMQNIIAKWHFFLHVSWIYLVNDCVFLELDGYV